VVELGVDRVPIGFTEAYGEALLVMATMAAFSAGRAEWEAVDAAGRLRHRDQPQPRPPVIATALIGRAALPEALAQRVQDLRAALGDTTDPMGEGAEAARAAWPALGVTGGYRPWRRAATSFCRR
jgi:DNA helicase II / ATP-dependent DNA helicase PcrA